MLLVRFAKVKAVRYVKVRAGLKFWEPAHPNVLKMNGFDADRCSGFAFGVGLERVAMLKYGIDDIRSFYTNDQRFLMMFDRFDRGE